MTVVLRIELVLKIRIFVLRWLAVVSDGTGAWVEINTRCARHKQYAHVHRKCLPHLHNTLVTNGLCRARFEKLQLDNRSAI